MLKFTDNKTNRFKKELDVQSTNMDPPPPKKKYQTAGYAIHRRRSCLADILPCGPNTLWLKEHSHAQLNMSPVIVLCIKIIVVHFTGALTK